MIFDDNRAMFADEGGGQLSGDQSAELFLGGRALNEHARHAYFQPVVRGTLNLEIQFLAAPVRAVRKIARRD
jgi:hypothetical protein